MSTPITAITSVTLDSADAARLAGFYADLTGGEVTGVYPEYGYAQATVGPMTLNFQTVESYRAPQWPGQEIPQQFHLDMRTGDLDAAVTHATGLGAREATEQPAPEAYRVLLDPDGHPFCVCLPQQ